jgi:hypothetical protein
MRWSRTYKFENKEAAAEFIRQSDPPIRQWLHPEYHSIRITCMEHERELWDSAVRMLHGKPVDEWEDKF